MQTIEELAKTTGLKVKFLRRCTLSLRPFLKKHVTRGAKNSLLYKDGAIAIFDQVRILKDQGYSLPSIEKELGNLIGSTVENAGNFFTGILFVNL